MSPLAWTAAEALFRATVRVERHKAGQWVHSGTAFFATDTLLLTCAHLVTGGADTRVVSVGPAGPRVHPVECVRRTPDAGLIDDYPLPDVAVLRVVGDPFDGPLPQLSINPPGDDLLAYGYTDEYRSGQALGHSARSRLAGAAEAARGAGPSALRMLGDRIRGGMSGSPVLDLGTGGVIGITKRTQDQSRAIGAFVIPMRMVIAAAPEVAADRDLTDPLDLAAQLWGELFWGTVALLIDSAGARTSLAQRLELAVLIGDDDRQARLLAARLFQLDLERLSETLQHLFDIFGDNRASRLFDLVATMTTFRGEPWIAPDVAGELSAQVKLAAADPAGGGRMLDLRSPTDLRRPYRRRGGTGRASEAPLECGPFSHEVAPDTGLPVELERDLRAGILKKFPNSLRGKGFDEPSLSVLTAERWRVGLPHLVSTLRERGAVVLLPEQLALDRQLVDRLIADYPLVHFTTSTVDPPADVLAASGYQVLRPEVDDNVARKAFEHYDSTIAALTGG